MKYRQRERSWFSVRGAPPTYRRALILLARRRRAGDRSATMPRLIADLLQAWVQDEEHRWAERQQPLTDLW